MKSPITLKLYLLERRKKANGEMPVYLRITQNREYKLLSTGISIEKKYWNPDAGSIRRTHPRHKSLNAQLDDILYQAKQKVLSLPEEKQNASLVKQELTYNGKDEFEFFTFAERFIDELKVNNKFWEWKQTRVTLGKFRTFVGSSKLPMDEVSVKTLENFKHYLIHEVGNGPNTINKQFQRIRRIIKRAIKDELIISDPFLNFERLKGVKSEKTRLSFEQIKSIEALQLKRLSGLDITRDAFLFSFYNAGIRFGDLARLKWGHIIDGRLKYNMAKTGKGKNIKLLSKAQNILDKYNPTEYRPNAFIFPVLNPDLDYSDEMFLKQQISSKNVIANKNLKKLASLAGIQEHISFHVSRHSFADYARTVGMNVYDISNALGHSNINITQAYLKNFDETSLDQGMEKLFSN